ncbi:nitrilase-related carbon-nitrogen hydrolase [Microbispora sp. NPDC049125]|uniref:nitrilase-related carbon-nitrogen hydrolase n=1 Tax=Microbispora sp. NPDC049125 TaxID=3154929 RepID=UPI00346613FC
MRTNPNPTRLTAAAVLGTGLSAGLLYFGTGLDPIPWLTWIAPLPVLLLAPRVSAFGAAVAALTAWTAGGLGMWSLYRDRLELPLPLALLNLLTPALVAAVAVLTFRALLRRALPALAAVAVPAIWVSAEYLVAVLTPNGAIWTLAATQADLVPVLQIAAITGAWGVSFLVAGLPAALAAAVSPWPPGTAGSRWVGAGAVVVVILAAGAGAVRLSLAAPHGPALTVAMIASRQQDDWAPIDTPRGRERLGEVVTRVRALPPGTGAVVLPEGGFVTTSARLPLITAPLAALARERGLDIVAGVIVTDANYNAAMFFPASGGAPAVYRKQHMVPGVEPYTPGDRLLVLPGVGVAICKDLDFPELARQYRSRGAELMLLPAWDFDVDGRQHARVALMRGVENGMWLVRGAADGELTVSDPYGRVVAAASTTGHAPTTLTATIRTGGADTFYTRAGDWFAWLCVAAAVLALAVAGRRPRGERRGRGVTR